jgi:protein-S-isoprenylcysteine O-methyltransferase Ste14
MRPAVIIGGLWLLFALSWLAAALWSSQPTNRLDLRAEMPPRIALILGGIIFFIPAHNYEGPLRIWYPNRELFWICIVLMLLGFAFAWWARIAMGTLWSGRITRKPDHQILDTGPFGIVRHPIYTGILLAVLGTLLVKGTVLGIIGALVITVGIWMKARLEERWLSAELGAAAYHAYRQRVPMLVPYWPR